MRGLGTHIESAIITIIKGLKQELLIDFLDDAKMKNITESKVESFNSAKKLMGRWVNSPNAPSKEKAIDYVNQIIEAGYVAIGYLEDALSKDIDYDALKEDKHSSAVKAKPLILESIYSLESGIIEMKMQLDSGKIDFNEKEFKIGYPERYAKGEFFAANDYCKKWYDSENDAVIIDPKGTKGELIEISELKIWLPEVPADPTEILFYDLPKEDQYWRRTEEPVGLNTDNVEMYHDYIMEEYRRRREGVWFMNNGTPVYMPGNMYWALQWCKMFDDGQYMKFRYAQLEMFYHLEACIIDKRCLGQLFLKSRRTGFTYVILAILLNLATSTKNGKYGMTSKTEDDVEEAFQKFSYMYLNLPFYFRPVVKGKEDSLTMLEFGKPSNATKEAKLKRDTSTDDYLNTVVDYRATKDSSYDSVKLNGYLGDESAKWTKPNDYVNHLGQIRPTMMPNGRVVGKAFIGSTMGALSKGGSQYRELIKGSLVKDRNEITGKTPTGLYFHFLPAQKNMEQFTDKYGKCWEETPPPGTLNSEGEPILIGSIDYLIAVENDQKAIGDKALNEQYRTYPRTMEHAMRDESSETVFNINKIHAQLEHNEKQSNLYVTGNFRWKDGIRDSEVEWCPDPKGRFKLAWIPSDVDNTLSMRNNVKNVNGKFYPLNKGVGALGCDPFTLKSTHGKGSKGAIHGKTLIIPEGNAPANKFFLEYIARPSDETVFFEDVIMACRFYGMPILVESNRIDLLRHMRNRGYRGFALDRVDRPANKLNPNEIEYGGQLMSGKDIIDSHMNSIGSWIEDYVGESHKEEIRPVGQIGDMPFEDTLRDWLSFDPDNRTEYDPTISSGLCIMACQKEKYKGKKHKPQERKVIGLIQKYNNNGDFSTVIN